jgi:hypothetical protein
VDEWRGACGVETATAGRDVRVVATEHIDK